MMNLLLENILVNLIEEEKMDMKNPLQIKNKENLKIKEENLIMMNLQEEKIQTNLVKREVKIIHKITV